MTREAFIRLVMNAYPSMAELWYDDETLDDFLERASKEPIGDTLFLFIVREFDDILGEGPMTAPAYDDAIRALDRAIEDLSRARSKALELQAAHFNKEDEYGL